MYRYSAIKDRLISNGYVPLPVIPNDKKPAIAGWTSPLYQPPNGYDGYSVGIKCGIGQLPIAGIDCDILDPDISQKMLDFCLKNFGETVYRIGRAPKTMLLYRASSNVVKQTSGKLHKNGTKLCIEILGSGQQFVAFGRHPETKNEYTWPGLFGDILDMPVNQLPVIGVVDMQRIIEYFREISVEAGYSFEKKIEKQFQVFDPDDPLDNAPPIGLDFKKCEEMLKGLNPDCSRDEWRNVGMALHHEFSGSPEAMELWRGWSAKGQKYKDGEPEKQWESFGRYTGRPITAAYLLKLTKKEEENILDDVNFFSSQNWSVSRFQRTAPELPMLIEGFLAQGVVALFYSAGGAGKSTMLLDMSIRVALNQFDIQFLGHVVNGGKVVILTAEDPEIILNRRLVGIIKSIAEELNENEEVLWDALGKSLQIISTFGSAVKLFTLKNERLQVTKHYNEFKEYLLEIVDLKLVVVDTKTRFSPGEGLGNVTATDEIAHYEAISRDTGASIVLLHHSNKSSRDGSQTGAQAYRDATALFDSVRAAWYLRSLKPEEGSALGIAIDDSASYLLLENSKNNYIIPHKDKVVIREGYRYSVKAVSVKMTKAEIKENRRAATYDKVIDVLQNAKQQSFSQAEIVRICRDKIGVGRRLVADTIEELESDGLLERQVRNKAIRIMLTDEGKNYNLEIK